MIIFYPDDFILIALLIGRLYAFRKMSLTDDFGHFQLNIFLSKVKRKIHVSRIFKFFTNKLLKLWSVAVCSTLPILYILKQHSNNHHVFHYTEIAWAVFLWTGRWKCKLQYLQLDCDDNDKRASFSHYILYIKLRK